jgi:phage protein D
VTEYYVTGLTVRIEGEPLPAAYVALLERAVVDDHVFLPAMFVLTFRDPDHDVLAGAGFEVGATVTIEAASHDGTSTSLVEGEVNALEGEFTSAGSHVVVRGYDRSHRLHRGRKTRSWTQMKDSDVVSEIAGAAGIPVGRVDATSVMHEHLVQPNLTDWEFLMLRSREVGYDVAIVNGRLEFRKPAPASGGPAPGTLQSREARQLVLGRTLMSFRPRVSAAQQIGTVEVRGWDAENKQAVVASASAGTNSTALDVGPAVLAGTFGESTYVAVERGVSTAAEVEALASALAERIGGVSAEAEGIAEGDPGLRAGTPISVGLVGHPFEGRYVLSATRHVFDEDGYRTHFVVSGREDRSLFGLASVGGARG